MRKKRFGRERLLKFYFLKRLIELSVFYEFDYEKVGGRREGVGDIEGNKVSRVGIFFKDVN